MELAIHALHVVDTADFGETVATQLPREDERIEVHTATNTEEGLEILAERDIDCVVSSAKLPDSNGAEFFERLQEDYPTIPFLLYADADAADIVSDAIIAGVTDYLQQQEGADHYAVLADRIATAVESRRSRRSESISRRILSELVDTADDVLFMFSADWSDLVFVNAAYEDTWGANISELEADPTSFLEYIHEDDLETVRQAMAAASGGEANNIEYRVVRPDGEQRWVLVDVKPIFDDTGAVVRVGGYARDITDQKKRQKKLLRYSYAFESSLGGIAVASRDGELTDVNPAFRNMWGFDDSDEILGRSVTAFWKDPQRAASVMETVTKQGEWEGELEAVRNDDSTFFVRALASHLTNDDGDPIGVIASFVDITEQKETEQKLEEQRNNLEVLNEILRHDIRNYLHIVTAYADMLADTVGEDAQEYVGTIRDNAKQSIELTTTARDMSDVWLSDMDEQIQISLKVALKSELDEIRSAHTDSVITLDGSIPDQPILANDMINTVFHNLLQNAIRHNDKDTPKVTVWVDENDETVEVHIADNGPGVPDGQKEDIFGKGEKGLDSSGTGLGLYLVKTLVEGYDGAVWLEDNESEGAVFVVELQKAAAGAESSSL